MNFEERQAWRLYFLTAVGWGLHPGYKRQNAAGHEEAIQFAFDIANRMQDMEKRQMAYWGAIAQGAMEIGTAWLNSDAQHKSNRMNLRISREQRDFEERMSNTAIQRRAKDIELAGGNRALAFTTGSEASTPTYTPAHMEAPRVQAPQLASALVQAQNLKNMKAEEFKTTQEGRGAKIAADLAEGTYSTEIDKRVNRNIEEHEWDDLKTEFLRNTNTSSAAQAKRESETVDSLIQTARQQADTGKLELDALRNIAEMGGIEAGKASWLIKLVIGLVTRGMK